MQYLEKDEMFEGFEMVEIPLDEEVDISEREPLSSRELWAMAFSEDPDQKYLEIALPWFDAQPADEQERVVAVIRKHRLDLSLAIRELRRLPPKLFHYLVNLPPPNLSIPYGASCAFAEKRIAEINEFWYTWLMH